MNFMCIYFMSCTTFEMHGQDSSALRTMQRWVINQETSRPRAQNPSTKNPRTSNPSPPRFSPSPERSNTSLGRFKSTPTPSPRSPLPPKQPSENPSTASSVYGGSATPTNTDTTSCSCRECECDCDCDQGVTGGQDLCGYCAKYCR